MPVSVPVPVLPARRRRRSPAPLAVVLALLVGACSTGGASPGQSPATAPPIDPSATVTTIERRVGDAATVVEVVRSGDGASATMTVVHGDGRETVVVEEVRIGTDHWVHAAAAEGVLLDRAAWIHFDLTDPRQARFLEEHPVGLLGQVDLFDRGPGVRVRRRTAPAPVVTVPAGLPIVPFPRIETLAGER